MKIATGNVIISHYVILVTGASNNNKITQNKIDICFKPAIIRSCQN